jgi:Domain of unknown function (DUF3597)
MSIFGKIASAIFGSPAAAPVGLMSAVPATDAAAAATPVTPVAAAAAAPIVQASAATPVAAAAPAAPAAAAAPAAPVAVAKPTVDVTAILDGIKAKQGEALEWRKSIVDLMKLLKLDSSLTARKELAKELHYSGDMSDSASMNVWLHKQVMTKLAENGGIVPNDLKH